MDNPFAPQCVELDQLWYLQKLQWLSGLEDEARGLSESEDACGLVRLSKGDRHRFIGALEEALVCNGGLRWYVAVINGATKCSFAFMATTYEVPAEIINMARSDGLMALSDVDLIWLCFSVKAVCALQVEVWVNPSDYWVDLHRAKSKIVHYW